MVPLPEMFRTRVHNLFGPEGNEWLKALPALRGSLLDRWSLSETQPINQLSYNYLEYASSPIHGSVVLKMGFPNPELLTEIKTLQAYRRLKGVVKLLDFDIDQGALLLERIHPGRNLTSLSDDEEATRIAAQTMSALRQPEPQGSEFPTMETWCQGFSRYSESYGESEGPLPEAIFKKGMGLVKELLESPEERFLLHGDLHHYNILSREDGTWAVIDPKGVTGELAFEVGPYLGNPIPNLIRQPNLVEILRCRLRIFEGITGLDLHRLTAWSFCRTLLSAIWTIEEGDDHLDYWVEITEKIGQLV